MRSRFGVQVLVPIVEAPTADNIVATQYRQQATEADCGVFLKSNEVVKSSHKTKSSIRMMALASQSLMQGKSRKSSGRK